MADYSSLILLESNKTDGYMPEQTVQNTGTNSHGLSISRLRMDCSSNNRN